MKTVLVITSLLLTLRLSAQNPTVLPDRTQRWKELNLTLQQKEQIRIIIMRQRMQQYLDWAELNRILSKEQKKKLKEWKRLKDKKS
jgi:hypothetical protein